MPRRARIERRAERREQQMHRLQTPEREQHAEEKQRKQRREGEERFEQTAQRLRSDRAGGVVTRGEDQTQQQRRAQRPGLIGNGQAHPNSRAKKPSPRTGSSS